MGKIFIATSEVYSPVTRHLYLVYDGAGQTITGGAGNDVLRGFVVQAASLQAETHGIL